MRRAVVLTVLAALAIGGAPAATASAEPLVPLAAQPGTVAAGGRVDITGPGLPTPCPSTLEWRGFRNDPSDPPPAPGVPGQPLPINDLPVAPSSSALTEVTTAGALHVWLQVPATSRLGGMDIELVCGPVALPGYGRAHVVVVDDPVVDYVTAVYRDLRRPLPPETQDRWVRALHAGTDRGAVPRELTSDAQYEFELLGSAYLTYLRRPADVWGLNGWLAARRSGLSHEAFEAGLLDSVEYYVRQGGGTDAGWVASLYRDVLGRSASPAEVAAWADVVHRQGRGPVALGFTTSTEHLAARVDGYYRQLLHRPAELGGQLGWARALQRGLTDEALAVALASSPEYVTGASAR